MVKTRFTQSDVARVVKGMEAAGKAVERVEIMQDGRIVAHIGAGEQKNDADAALEAWERGRGSR